MRKISMLSFIIAALLLVGCAGGAETPPAVDAPQNDTSTLPDFSGRIITFANAGWDSAAFHNAVAGFIAVEGFGYGGWYDFNASTPVLHEGLLRGEVDIQMESWVENTLDFFPGDVEAGLIQEFGVNFDDNAQGLYVPRFVIYGDPVRGIEPMAPTLRTVQDLARYAHVFPDPETPGRGRIYGAIPGWAVDQIMYNKIVYNELDTYFEYFRPGSEAAMNANFANAYERGEAIVGYYWEPTWLLGMYDFVLLEDFPFTNDDDFTAGRTEFPAVTVVIATSNLFADENPEFVEFLRRYRTTSAMINEALAYMGQTGASHADTAEWFLRNNPQLIDEWLDPDQAQAVRSALE